MGILYWNEYSHITILPAVLCIVILVAESNEISVLKSLVLNAFLS